MWLTQRSFLQGLVVAAFITFNSVACFFDQKLVQVTVNVTFGFNDWTILEPDGFLVTKTCTTAELI